MGLKKIKSEDFIYIIFIIVMTLFLFLELNIKKNMYSGEKIDDLAVQYNSELLLNAKVSEVLLLDILDDLDMKQIMLEANENKKLDFNREKLYNLYKLKYLALKEKGILQFHFHLSNGNSFLRFHKTDKYGDSLLFRDSIKKVIETKKKVIGFEVGRYFEGFRYVYPIIHDSQYIGSLEVSFKSSSLLDQMKETLDADYLMILKSKIVENLIVEEHVKKYYHKFCVDDNYYMSNFVHNDNSMAKKVLMSIKKQIYSHMQTDNAFLEYGFDENNNMKLFTFLPILDVNGEKVGYLFSIRDDSILYKIFIMQSIKFLIGLILISLLLYFYKQNKQKTNTIVQLQNLIDKTTIVSKSDLKGKITYINQAFEEISGYSKNELLGSSHNIIRDDSMQKETFKELWTTIKNKKVWQGIIKNKKKDGSIYIVDVTIFPILDIENEIMEFVAIRHDVTELENYKEILKKQLNDTTKSLDENINYLNQYEEAINNSVAVLKTNIENNITYVNEHFCKISGYSKKDLINETPSIFRHSNHINMDDASIISEKMRNNEPVSIVFTNIKKDKTLFFSDTAIYPITNSKNKLQEYLYLMHDVSEIINLHQEIEDTQKEIIYKMGEIAESRSKETGNHVKRVAEYSKLLAILYGLDENESELLKQSSPMHDIGKVGIPDRVLNKPGKLTSEEWVVMKTHSHLGYEMLKHSNRPILKAASTVAKEHHEKWDGSGYPRGLSGENIHIYGRITALADVFDALGSDRVYKKAWEFDRILDFFKDQRGKHFEPKLVDLFFENIDKFLEIRDKFKDEL